MEARLIELGPIDGVEEITNTEIGEIFKGMKAWTTVPDGRLPKEMWQKAMDHRRTDLSPPLVGQAREQMPLNAEPCLHE